MRKQGDLRSEQRCITVSWGTELVPKSCSWLILKEAEMAL